jgi:hypothetical protein
MNTTSLDSTVSRIRLATVVLPDPVPPDIPIIKLIPYLSPISPGKSNVAFYF